MSWSTSSIDCPASTRPRRRLPSSRALARVEARGGLVEADEARRGDERAGDADELALALRQLVRHRVEEGREAEQLEHLGVRVASVAGRPHRLLEEPPHRRSVRGDVQVLAHGEVVEQLDRLPRARQPEPRAPVRGEPRQVGAVEPDRALASGRSR